MQRKVTVIPQTINPITHLPKDTKVRRKVAAYARVSTDNEEQLTSYEAQVDYYTRYIKSRDDWEFVGVFTDEGISGTSTKRREGFNRMIEEALNGKINLIITKSVSRFARNTVDSLTTIRKLKEKNVECYFEKENIWTFDSKGELLLTIMSSLAQEESRSISENVTWGQRKRFADGKVSLPYKRFLGYRKGSDGLPEVVPEEAEIVRFIYKSFLDGQTPYMIAKTLTDNGVPTPAGKEKWAKSTIESILTNEKYKGAALLQKMFTTDFLTKKRKVNNGEVPQYYIEQSHEPIISPEEFEQVQAEITRRQKLGRKYSGNSIFAAKLVCGDCGSFFGSKVWHSNSKYRRVIWQCNSKFKGEHFCCTPHYYEDEIKLRFVNAFSVFFQSKDLVIETSQSIVDELSDTSSLDNKISRTAEELERITYQTREHIQNNIHQTPDEYNARYEELVRQFEEKETSLQKLQRKRDERLKRAETMQRFISSLGAMDSPDDTFDEALWKSTVEKVTVFHDNKMIFQFLDGTEVEG